MNTKETFQKIMASHVGLAAKNDQDHIKIPLSDVRHLIDVVYASYYEGILEGRMDSQSLNRVEKDIYALSEKYPKGLFNERN